MSLNQIHKIASASPHLRQHRNNNGYIKSHTRSSNILVLQTKVTNERRGFVIFVPIVAARLTDNTLTRTSGALSTDSNWIIIINLLGGHRVYRFTYNGTVSLRDFFHKHALLCKASDRTFWQTDEWKYGCSMVAAASPAYWWVQNTQEL